jgi:hypothetical protein
MNYRGKHIHKMMEWCRVKWGRSKYQPDYPSLVIHRETIKEGDSDWDISGFYCEKSNTIHIYPKHHTSYLEMCDTIIHEYTHYLQNIDQMYMKYIDIYSYNYHNHPYEKVANKRAEKFKWECFNSVFS